MSRSLLSDKQLNRLVTQKTNHSGDNNGIVGTWTYVGGNSIQPFYPDTGPHIYTKLELTGDKLEYLTSFNSDFSDPIAYINREYKFDDNTIRFNIANDDGSYIFSGYPIPNVSQPGSTGSGFHKFSELTFIITPSTNIVFAIIRFNLVDQTELNAFKQVLLQSSNLNVFNSSVEYFFQLNRTM